MYAGDSARKRPFQRLNFLSLFQFPCQVFNYEFLPIDHVVRMRLLELQSPDKLSEVPVHLQGPFCAPTRPAGIASACPRPPDRPSEA